VLLDRLRRMQAVPKNESVSARDGKAQRRRRRGSGKENKESGVLDGGVTRDDDSTALDTAQSFDNTFGSLQMSPVRSDHRNVSFNDTNLSVSIAEAKQVPGNDGSIDGLDVVSESDAGGQQGRPPRHPGYAEKIQRQEEDHANIPDSPVFATLGERTNDDDEEDKGNDVKAPTRRSGDKWEALNLFDALNMTQAEREEAEKIYKIRCAREASNAFAVGGRSAPLNPAPLLSSSLGINKIPALHKKTASNVENDYHRARRNIALRDLQERGKAILKYT